LGTVHKNSGGIANPPSYAVSVTFQDWLITVFGFIALVSGVFTAILVFKDSGAGIPEKILPEIFSPLVTTKAKGMSFSLAISRRILEAHNGEIKVESIEGKGATFTIILPVEPTLEFYVETGATYNRQK
jgi:signal transduction histidine kinase